MQHDYVHMLLINVNIGDNYVKMRFKIIIHNIIMLHADKMHLAFNGADVVEDIGLKLVFQSSFSKRLVISG